MAQRQFFRLTDFTGGWNPDQNAIMLDDSEATELRNFRLDKVGSLLSRRGLQVAVQPNGPGPMLALGRAEPTSDPTTFEGIAVDDQGRLWEASGREREFLPTSGYQPGFNVSAEPPVNPSFLTTSRGTIYVSEGHIPQLYRANTGGTSRVTRLGVPGVESVSVSPLATPFVPGLKGSYGYAVTLWSESELTESAPILSERVSVNQRPVSVSILTGQEHEHSLATHFRIYRTLGDGAVYLFHSQQLIGNSLTFTDSKPDAELRQPAVNFDEGPPLEFERMVYHRGYYFASIGRTIFWSRYENPHSWPPFNNTEVPFGASETVTALASFQDALLIFSRNNTVLLAGSAGNWSLSRQDVDLGCVGQHAMVELDRGLAFVSERGVFSFPGFEEVAPKLNRVIASLTPALRSAARMVSVPEERALWLTVADQTYCIHLLNAGLSTYSFTPTFYLAGGESSRGAPWMLFPDAYRVAEYGGTTDFGEPINVTYRSKIFQLQNPEMTKHLRRVGAFATQGSQTVMTISVIDQAGYFPVVMEEASQSGTIYWDFFNWDDANWPEEGIGYFIGSLPAGAQADRRGLLGLTVQVAITASTTAVTEVVPPITLEYRESGRFLGG